MNSHCVCRASSSGEIGQVLGVTDRFNHIFLQFDISGCTLYNFMENT